MTDVYVGADLGGTNFRVGVRRAGDPSLLQGQVSVSADSSWGPDELAEQLQTLFQSLQAPGEAGWDLHGIGIALTGDVNPFTGVCHSMPRFRRLEETPLAALLTERLRAPVFLLNDGLAAALAEQQFGAGRGVSDFLMVTLGTGIGGGVVLNGRLLTGSHGRIGRVGHQIIGLDGPVHCHCRHPGCWQSFAGKAAIETRAASTAGSFPDSELARHLAKGEPSIKAIVRSASEDEASAAVLKATGRYVGIGLANLVKLFAPERIVLGGGIAQDNPVLLQAVEATLRQYAVKPWQVVPVVPAQLGQNAGLIGASLIAMGIRQALLDS